MTKSDELVLLLDEVNEHCTNTFCNTCPYYQISDERPCSYYAAAQKLIDEGYCKVDDVIEYQKENKRLKEKLQAVLLNADIIKDFSKSISIHEAYAKGAKDVLEKLKMFKTAYDNDGDGDLKVAVPIDEINKLLKEYEND